MDILSNVVFSGSVSLIIILCLNITLCIYFHGPSYRSAGIEYGPPILTSIGIFGTFLGVALGLMAFDTANIQSSVPPLIEGLKTAFWSSILGLFCALTLKIRFAFTQMKPSDEMDEGAIDIVDLVNRLDMIYHALVGDNGVRAEMSNYGEETSNQLSKLHSVIKTYQDRMVEMNTDALVGAIDSVMRDFNAKINEQYGDNFKKFNHSVKLILIWQRQHKEQIQEFAEQQKRISSSLTEATKAYEHLVCHSEGFASVAKTLSKALKTLDNQSHDLATYIQKMALAIEQASDGLPRLEYRIGDLTDKLDKTISQSSQMLSQSVQKNSEHIERSLEKATDKLSLNLDEMHSVLGQHVLDIVKRSEEQIAILDGALEAELNKALVTLGAQLAALSEKFVHDYTPLTDRLREVVRLAEVETCP